MYAYIYTKQFIRDLQDEGRIRLRNWEGHDDIEYQNSAFLEVVIELYNKSNIDDNPIAFVDVMEFYKEENSMQDHELDTL